MHNFNSAVLVAVIAAAVDGGERAVIFDRFRGILSEVEGEGTHLRIPWVQTPHIMDIRTRPRSISSVTGTKGTSMHSTHPQLACVHAHGTVKCICMCLKYFSAVVYQVSYCTKSLCPHACMHIHLCCICMHGIADYTVTAQGAAACVAWPGRG